VLIESKVHRLRDFAMMTSEPALEQPGMTWTGTSALLTNRDAIGCLYPNVLKPDSFTVN
jgi:hypothetical protein